MDIGVTCLVPAAEYHAAASREQLIQGLGYQSKKFVCCLSGVLIQKEIRNFLLSFQMKISHAQQETA